MLGLRSSNKRETKRKPRKKLDAKQRNKPDSRKQRKRKKSRRSCMKKLLNQPEKKKKGQVIFMKTFPPLQREMNHLLTCMRSCLHRKSRKGGRNR